MLVKLALAFLGLHAESHSHTAGVTTARGSALQFHLNFLKSQVQKWRDIFLEAPCSGTFDNGTVGTSWLQVSVLFTDIATSLSQNNLSDLFSTRPGH